MGASSKDRRSKPHYIYFVRCPATGHVRYIGLSLNPTGRVHADPPMLEWKKDLRERGYGSPVLEPIIGPLTFEQAKAVEMRLVYLHSQVYPGRILNTYRPRFAMHTQTFAAIQWVTRASKRKPAAPVHRIIST